jgi:hypothetical protein
LNEAESGLQEKHSSLLLRRIVDEIWFWEQQQKLHFLAKIGEAGAIKFSTR